MYIKHTINFKLEVQKFESKDLHKWNSIWERGLSLANTLPFTGLSEEKTHDPQLGKPTDQFS